jgi:hypothetical protein
MAPIYGPGRNHYHCFGRVGNCNKPPDYIWTGSRGGEIYLCATCTAEWNEQTRGITILEPVHIRPYNCGCKELTMPDNEVIIKRRTTNWKWAILQPHTVKINGQYMLKRLKIIQTPWFAILLTKIYKPDSERYPHSHYRPAISWILSGGYTERIYRNPQDLSAYNIKRHVRWSFHTIPAEQAHSIRRVDKPLWTLLFAGPVTGEFVFWTPDGKVDYTEYGTGK